MFWYKGQTYASLWDCRNIGKDGVSVSFSTSEKRQDGTYENSNWNGTAFGKQAEILKKMGRGDRFVINTAKISVRSYEKDGVRYYPTNVTLIDIEPVSSVNSTNHATKSASKKTIDPAPVDTDDDEEAPW